MESVGHLAPSPFFLHMICVPPSLLSFPRPSFLKAAMLPKAWDREILWIDGI